MKSHGNRKFYHLPDTPPSSECGNEEFQPPGRSTKKFRSKSAHFRGSTRDLMQMIDHNIIGKDTTFQGPFGPRKSVYMDHTASGQPLRCIEGFINDNVMPYYGNTHTTTTLTSSQTTMYRHEAKDIVRNSVGASEHDAVIFCGSGATGAVHKLVQALAGDGKRPKPVVFSGPFEHHSNLLPWRDVGAKMVYIPETKTGNFDVEFLEKSLQEAVADEDNKGRLLIGCFSVGSNITGVVTDDVAVTILMHKYGGLAFWDYAAAAAHIQIVMNPVVASDEGEGLARKDALYFSGHKFVGGPQTPGVLVAKKSIFDSHMTPNGAGGGTVFFVTQDSHRYLKNVEYREEGGTPAIIESIRLGLVFRLKDTVGSHNIVSQEAMYAKKALQEWANFPEIKILGPGNAPRLPIISFLIQHPETGYYLHYNYVVALLNDLFGIQSRGGCACAGPYAQALMGIDLSLAKEYESLLLEDSRLDRDHLRRYLEGSPYEIFRPGFTRLSIPFHASMAEAEFVIEAVQLIAQHGWKLLPLYTFNPETGEFHHHANHMLYHRKWLSWASFDSDGIRCKERVRNNSEDCVNYKECLEQAKNILTNAHNMSKRRPLPDQSLLFDSKFSRLKWFLLPSEAQSLMANDSSSSSIRSPEPFTVHTYGVTEEAETGSKNRADPASLSGLLSVPKQLQKSCWSVDQSLKISANRIVEIDNLTEVSTGSELNISSNENESENEYQVPGTTVVGPSICFSAEMADGCSATPSLPSSISGLCVTNEEPVRDPRLSQDMGENYVVKDSRGECYGRLDSYKSSSNCDYHTAEGSLSCDKVVPIVQNNSSEISFEITSNPYCPEQSNLFLLATSNAQTMSSLPTNSYNSSVISEADTHMLSQNGMTLAGTMSQCSLSNSTDVPVSISNANTVPGTLVNYNEVAESSYTQPFCSSPNPPTQSFYDQNLLSMETQQIQRNGTAACYNHVNGSGNLSTYCGGGDINGGISMMNGSGNQVNVTGANNQMCGGLTVNTAVNQVNGVVSMHAFQHSPQICNNINVSPSNSNAMYPQDPSSLYNTPLTPGLTYANCVNDGMSVNGGTTTFEYPSCGWTNNGQPVYNAVSPVPVSPHPQQNASNYGTPVQQDCFNSGSYSSTPISPQIQYGTTQNTHQVTPQAASSQHSESLRSEMMKDAMRRVTNQLANELKSEIREVISQVEQGIDPESIRERANSFTAKDRTLEGLKSRTRTLSGHVLSGNLKKNSSSDGQSRSFDETVSSRDSSYPSSTSSCPMGSSVDLQLMQESVTSEIDVPRIGSDKADENQKPSGEMNEAGDPEMEEQKQSPGSDQVFVGDEKGEIVVGKELGSSKVSESEGVGTILSKPKVKWHCPPKGILKQTLKGLNEFSMLKDGDRVLLCLSGGKDSLSMLHIMKQVQYNLAKSGISFTLGAVTVDPGSSSYNPRPLIPYLEALGVPYFYEEQGIMRSALEKGPEEVASICSFCSRMKRGRIYACARKYGYNVIALGQHLDDLAESFFMSIFHNGLLRTMKATYTVKEGDLRVIRPLVNVREKALRDFAESKSLPVIPENCPACFDAPKERHRIKQMLAQQEILFPKIYVSLRAAMQPLIAVSQTGMETKKNVAKNLVDVNLSDGFDDE